MVGLNTRPSPHSCFGRFFTCVSAVSGVSLVGVSLLSADVADVVLGTLLDPSTHFRPLLTHNSHHRPALVDLSRFRISPILTHSHFRCFYMCVSGVSVVFLVGVSLLSADVAVAVVKARGHISASFNPQRSNKGPVESSRRGAHDCAITPNPSEKKIIWDFMTLHP